MGADHQSLISFGPIFCIRPSPSCKAMARDLDRKRWQRTAEGLPLPEPASPRVGCMGQIRRDRDRDKIPILTKPSSKLLRLKKIFSGKNMSAPEAGARVQDSTAAACSLVDVDPPLPVPKPLVKDPEAISLWRRRRGQQTLESLPVRRSCPFLQDC